MAIGRISGSVLKSNLTRNGTDLAFETNLLYLDVTNSRIGIGTSEPSTALQVSGTTTTTDLTVSSDATVRGTTFTDRIQSTGSNANIVLDPQGTGVIDVNSTRVTNVATPAADGDAATKAYVDSQLASADTLQEVTDNGATTTNETTFSGGIITSKIKTSDSSSLYINSPLRIDGLGSQNEILIVGANGLLSSTSTLSIDSGNNYVGINQTSPEVTLHMTGEGAQSTQIRMEQYNDTADAPDIRSRRYRGTAASPSAVQSGDYLFRSNHEYYNGTGLVVGGAFAFDNTNNAARTQFSVAVDTDGTGADPAGSNGQFKIDGNDGGAITFNNAYKFPTSDGSANQVLQTNGSGTLSFANVTITDTLSDITGRGASTSDQVTLSGGLVIGGNIETSDSSNINFADAITANTGTSQFYNLQVNNEISLGGAGSYYSAYNEDSVKVKFANWYSSNDRQYGQGQLWYEMFFGAVDNTDTQNRRRIGFYLDKPNKGASNAEEGSGAHPNNHRAYIDVNSFTLSNKAPLRFEEAIDDSSAIYYTQLQGQSALSANRTITLPDATGTVVLQDSTDTLTNKTLGATTIAGNLIPDTTETYDLGSSTLRFNDIYLAGTTVDIGGTKLSKTADGDVEIKDSSDVRKKIIVDEVHIGSGANKIKLSRGANGKLKKTDENDVSLPIITVVGDDSSGTDFNTGEDLKIAGGTNITTAMSGDTLTITGATAITANSIASSDSSAIQINDGLNVSGTLSANTIDTNVISSTDSSAIRINDGLSMAGHIIPAGGSYDLGSATSPWRDVYVSAGSLYVNNKQILLDDSGTITLQTDADENLVIKTTGTGQTTMQSAAGVNITASSSADITLTTNTGNIELKGTVEVLTGKQITDSAGTNVQFGDNIHMNNNKITNVSDPTADQDVATKAYVDNNTASLTDILTVAGDDSSGTSFNSGETLKIAGSQNVTTAISGDTLTVTGPDLSSYLQNLSEDTSPQLGGNLDLNSNNITGSGNINITGTLTTSGNVTVGGNLEVTGTTTTVDSQNLTIEDPIIELSSNNSGGSDVDAGILVNRGSAGNNAAFYWNEGDDKFKAVTTTSNASSTSITDSATATVVANLEGNVTGNVTGDVTGNADTATTLATARNIAGQSFDGSADITIASTDLSDTASIALLTSSQTLTNKTISGNSNTLSDIDKSSLKQNTITLLGDDSTGTAISLGEGFQIAGGTGITTAISGDVLTITGTSSAQGITVVGDDSSGTDIGDGETLKVAGATGITTAMSGDVLTITGPDLTNYLQSGTAVSVSDITATGTVYTDTITPPASNMDLTITASGTGSVSIGGFTLPSSDGSSGQVLQTNGSGTLSFTTVSTTSISEGNSSVTVADSGTGTITVSADGTNVAVFAKALAMDASGSTNAIKLPSGTTAQRPAGAVGMIRYNSSNDKYEVYTTADGWLELGATASESGVADSGSATIGIGLNTANIDSFTTSTYDSAWYYAVTNDEVNGQKATQKYSLVHNDTNAFVGVSHQIATDPDNDYLAVTADVSSGTVRIRGTGSTDTNSVSYYRVPLGDDATNTTSGAIKNFILEDTTTDSTDVNTYITTGESTAITSTEKSMDSFATSAFDSAWYLATHRDETNSDVKVEKYATAHNGSSAVISISGVTRNDDSNAYTQATADVSSSTFRLRGTATSATNSMSYWRIGLGDSTTQETVGATTTTVNTDVDSAAEQIDSWAHASYRGAKYYISAKNSDTSEVATTEALVVHDGTTAYVSQYNQIYTASGYPINITAAISGSNVVVSAGGDGNNWKVTTYRVLLSDSETDSNDGSTSTQGYTLNTVTVSSTATEIDSFASATTTGAFYVVTGASAGETAYSAQEVYVVTDGSDAYVTNGPFVSTKSTAQLSFTATYTGGNVSLKAASTSGASTTVSAYKVQMLRSDAGLATIDTFTGGTTNRAAKYYFSVNDTEGNRLTNTEALVVHDGTNAYITQYGTVNTSDTTLITLSAEYSGGTVYVKAVAGTSRVTGYRILLQDDQTATSSDNTAVIAETTGVSSTATEIDTWQTDAVTGAFYVVTGYNSTEGVASASEVMVVTGGSSPYNDDVFIGTGPTISSKSSDQLEFSATLSGTTVSVKAASTSGASTNVSAYRVNLLRGDGGSVAANVTVADDQSISGAKTFSAPVALQVSASAPSVETNKAHIYSKDVLVSADNYKAEIFVQDELGNETKISPHNAQGEWEYFSRNRITGKTVRVNMEELIRDIEQLTGKSYIKDE